MLAPTRTVHTEISLDLGRAAGAAAPSRPRAHRRRPGGARAGRRRAGRRRPGRGGRRRPPSRTAIRWTGRRRSPTLLRLARRDVVVPGHGAPRRPRSRRAQHAQLTELAWLIRDGARRRRAGRRGRRRAPFGPRAALVAVRRGYAELTGDTDGWPGAAAWSARASGGGPKRAAPPGCRVGIERRRPATRRPVRPPAARTRPARPAGLMPARRRRAGRRPARPSPSRPRRWRRPPVPAGAGTSTGSPPAATSAPRAPRVTTTAAAPSARRARPPARPAVRVEQRASAALSLTRWAPAANSATTARRSSSAAGPVSRVGRTFGSKTRRAGLSDQARRAAASTGGQSSAIEPQ